MRALRLQFFLTYAVLGSVVPYLPVLLREGKGLTDGEVGDIVSLSGWAIVLAPVTMTLLADLRMESKTLLGLMFLGSSVALAALLTAEGFWVIFLLFGLHALLSMPAIQVQDGLNFSVQQQRHDAGDTPVPYHRVRVWGTLGFMMPAAVLYLWLAADAPIEVALFVAVAFSLLGVANAYWLPAIRNGGAAGVGPPPDVPTPEDTTDDTTGGTAGDTAGATMDKDEPNTPRLDPPASASSTAPHESKDEMTAAMRATQAAQATQIGAKPRPTIAQRAARLPTVAALRAMCEPRVAVFAGAMWLCHLASAGYYTFYPIYLTEQIGLEMKWLGLIANIGVAVEIVFMLSFGLLLRRLGLRTLMALGAASLALRLGLLYALPNVWTAIGTQLLHGMTVLLIHVGPPVYLNQRAGAGYRSSIQGLYAMLIYGTGRIIGNMAGGRLAEWDLLAVFGVCALLCALAAGLFTFAFSEETADAA